MQIRRNTAATWLISPTGPPQMTTRNGTVPLFPSNVPPDFIPSLVLNDLTRRHGRAIGQRLITSFTGPVQIAAVQTLISDFGVASVLLNASNFTGTQPEDVSFGQRAVVK